MKTECIRPKAPVSPEDTKRVVGGFIDEYNTKRLHRSLGFVTPYHRLMGRHEEIFQARDTKLEAARARGKAARKQKPLAA
jgi:putative transposase